MTGHMISIGDVYELVSETKDAVIKMQEQLKVVVEKSSDHETRIHAAELKLAEVKDIPTMKQEIASLTRKVYAFSGGATVIGAVFGTIISLVVRS